LNLVNFVFEGLSLLGTLVVVATVFTFLRRGTNLENKVLRQLLWWTSGMHGKLVWKSSLWNSGATSYFSQSIKYFQNRLWKFKSKGFWKLGSQT